MENLKKFFTSVAHWSDVELLYKPPTASDIPKCDNADVGSSNHVTVFNKRLSAILNRIEFVRELIFSTALGELLKLEQKSNTILCFDVDGNLITRPYPCGFEVGDIKITAYYLYPNQHTDINGYLWHHALPENPINNSLKQYKQLFYLLWTQYDDPKKGDSVDDDWNMGFSIYLDIDGALVFMGEQIQYQHDKETL